MKFTDKQLDKIEYRRRQILQYDLEESQRWLIMWSDPIMQDLHSERSKELQLRIDTLNQQLLDPEYLRANIDWRRNFGCDLDLISNALNERLFLLGWRVGRDSNRGIVEYPLDAIHLLNEITEWMQDNWIDFRYQISAWERGYAVTMKDETISLTRAFNPWRYDRYLGVKNAGESDLCFSGSIIRALLSYIDFRWDLLCSLSREKVEA